jgi:peroxiredoxin
MLAAGDRMPDAQIWTAPREEAPLTDLLAEGPLLLVFYLFDWSGT